MWSNNTNQEWDNQFSVIIAIGPDDSPKLSESQIKSAIDQELAWRGITVSDPAVIEWEDPIEDFGVYRGRIMRRSILLFGFAIWIVRDTD